MKLLHRFALLSLLAAASVSAQLRGGNVRTDTTPDKMQASAPSELSWKDSFSQSWRKLKGGDDAEVNKMKALRTDSAPDKMKALRMKKEALEKKKALRTEIGLVRSDTTPNNMKALRMKKKAVEKEKAVRASVRASTTPEKMTALRMKKQALEKKKMDDPAARRKMAALQEQKAAFKKKRATLEKKRAAKKVAN